jgi:excisionase family DNA binding protein
MKEYLSAREVCEYLDVSIAYVYLLSHKNELPKYCPGGKLIWFKRSDIDQFLLNGRIASQNEINTEAEMNVFKKSKR